MGLFSPQVGAGGMGHGEKGEQVGHGVGQNANGMGHGMGQRRDRVQEGQGMGCRRGGTQDGMQAGWAGWDAVGMGHRQDRTWAGGPWAGQDALPTLPAPSPGQGSDGAYWAVVGTCWEPRLVPAVPVWLRASSALVSPSCSSATRTTPWSCTFRLAGSPCSPATPMPCMVPSSALPRPSWCCPTPPASLLFC